MNKMLTMMDALFLTALFLACSFFANGQHFQLYSPDKNTVLRVKADDKISWSADPFG